MDEERLTRRERQAQTRERLIEVASDELIRHGYRRTSLERVAEAAGFSKGAVYSNFSSKEELVLAVLDRRFLHHLDRLRDDLQAAPETPGDRLGVVTRWWADSISEPGWGALIFDLAGHSADKPEILDQLRQREHKIVRNVAMLVADEAQRFDIQLPMSVEAVATVLVSLGSGLAFSRQIDSTTPTEVMTDLARLVFGVPADD